VRAHPHSSAHKSVQQCCEYNELYNRKTKLYMTSLSPNQPRPAMLQLLRACPKSGSAPRISPQKRACPKHLEPPLKEIRESHTPWLLFSRRRSAAPNGAGTGLSYYRNICMLLLPCTYTISPLVNPLPPYGLYLGMPYVLVLSLENDPLSVQLLCTTHWVIVERLEFCWHRAVAAPLQTASHLINITDCLKVENFDSR